MAFNHSLSMANIVNVVEALNRGGMLSCEEIMQRVWENATIEQVSRKISAPRLTSLHNEDYARQQVKQEIRRTLHSHFNSIGRSYIIQRATPFGGPERFWVTEPQDGTVQPVTGIGVRGSISSDSIMDAISPGQVPVALYSNPSSELEETIGRLVTTLGI